DVNLDTFILLSLHVDSKREIEERNRTCRLCIHIEGKVVAAFLKNKFTRLVCDERDCINIIYLTLRGLWLNVFYIFRKNQASRFCDCVPCGATLGRFFDVQFGSTACLYRKGKEDMMLYMYICVELNVFIHNIIYLTLRGLCLNVFYILDFVYAIILPRNRIQSKGKEDM
ncbi:hypothetical protein ACJX0J_021824, partial [Zea mays]